MTHLHQQLPAEGVVVIVGEDLGKLAEGAETLSVNRETKAGLNPLRPGQHA